jgi:Icc-related predicted phosphoesterase
MMADPNGNLRIAAMADIHYSRTSQGQLQPVFAEIARSADVLLLCGDLTDYGLPEEAEILAKDLATIVKIIPVLGVLGNHDFESAQQVRVRQILSDVGVSMLDGETCEVKGVGFAGVKGFGGGFDQYMTTPWGEESMKIFVHEAVDEALKLETALAKLVTRQRIAVLHYAPIRATVEGESPEIYAFAGCSRLEDPLDHFHVVAAFHGHAHHGAPEGQTRGGVPVFNVAAPVLRRAYPDRPPYSIFEVLAEQDMLVEEHPPATIG